MEKYKLTKKNITFVINYFYPDLASTGQLMTDLCFELQDEFNITVIAGQPTYTGEDIKAKNILTYDKLENIKIIRIKLPTVNKNSKFSRIRYIFYYFILAIYALLKEKDIDVIYSISQPPILGGLLGTIGKILKNSKHVYNIQDFNPEQAAAINYTNQKFIFSLAKKIDKINCKLADHVVLVGQDMSETLKRRFITGKLPDYSVINNWTNEQEIIPLEKSNKDVSEFIIRNNLEDKFIVMYSGNLGLFYDLENIIKITKEFRYDKDIVFLFIGEGAVKREMMEFVEKNHLFNVIFLPYQPKNFIKYSLNVADVHLVVNQKGIKGVSVPSKIYGVMAAGKPILGVLEEGSEAHFLIKKSESGVVVEPQNYNEIVNAIRYFYCLDKKEIKDMGSKGREYLENNLKKEISINKYKKLLYKI
ncbi:glycosyltransferase family 4 protein [Fictibacillus sp. KIGAM418]|uniref:Glycosyltransferase family 4 protein n=1 Tax=Fictibacillus marinisediminis TaxID=2878389 RepID=A0A9X2BH57_9BACL|nr:glycosyltransferase family 4 protein [Fictibacillus marinisediminis]MCK6259017.1 glycosyltransferase family 4 protein [Fictibacillus marinisediminis]